MADRESEIEAVAEAIWTRMAELQDDPERGHCFSLPIETSHGPSTMWMHAEGAWRAQMLEIAATALDRVRGPQGEAQGGDAITGESGPAKARRVWEGSERGEHEAKSALLKATSEVPRLVRELDKARAEVEHLRSELAPSPQGEDHETGTVAEIVAWLRSFKSPLSAPNEDAPKMWLAADKIERKFGSDANRHVRHPQGEDHEALEAKVREVMASPSYATATDEQRARWIANHLAAQRP